MQGSAHFKELAFYYLLMFMKRMDIMLPFGLLIACIRALLTFNIHNELVVLLVSGLSIKKLLRPFLACGITCVMLMYLNYEVFIPYSWTKMKQIEDKHSSEGGRKQDRIQEVVLNDDTAIIYNSYDSARGFFFDAYWIRSINEIFRIKYLFPDSQATVGRKIDRLLRDDSGRLFLAESFDTKTLPELQFDEKILSGALRTPEELSLRQLWQRIPKHVGNFSDKEAHLLTRFYFRLAMPWLCLLVILAPTPFCVTFSRQPPILLIYILSILGLVSFYLIMDAAMVLGQAQVITPSLAIFIPFSLYFVFFAKRFVTMH